jgi:hypothetical protein
LSGAVFRTGFVEIAMVIAGHAIEECCMPICIQPAMNLKKISPFLPESTGLAKITTSKKYCTNATDANVELICSAFLRRPG